MKLLWRNSEIHIKTSGMVAVKLERNITGKLWLQTIGLLTWVCGFLRDQCAPALSLSLNGHGGFCCASQI